MDSCINVHHRDQSEDERQKYVAAHHKLELPRMLASLHPASPSGGFADFELVKDEPNCPDRHGYHGSVGKIELRVAATGIHHATGCLSNRAVKLISGR